MKLFDVLLTRDSTQSTVVRVEAENKEEAHQEALDEVLNHGGSIRWETNENYPTPPYLGDGEENDITEVARLMVLSQGDVNSYCYEQQNGWALFSTGKYGLEIEADSDFDTFESDEAAILAVRKAGHEREPHALAALAIHFAEEAKYWANKCRENDIRVTELEEDSR